MYTRAVICVGVSLVLAATTRARSHEPPVEREVAIDAPVASIAGTLMLPHAHDKLPCVVILGGTMSHDRDGAMRRPGAPVRDALKRLAQVLAEGGYASLRYDKVGYGGSVAKPQWRGAYHDEAAAAAAVIEYARARDEVQGVIVAGESAGAYLACLAAKSGTHADAYLFLGPLCGTAEDLYAYNFGRLAEYAAGSAERLAWAEKNLRYELALGRKYKSMLAAAARGDAEIELVDGNFRTRLGLARRKEELDERPDEMFRSIRGPALVLAGEHDLNVPPEHAARAAAIMHEAGNERAESALIESADHSFQQTPSDEQVRFRERYTFASFARPYQPAVYQSILAWLARTIPTPAEVDANDIAAAVALATGKNDPADAPSDTQADDPAPALDEVRIDPKTGTTPRRIQLAPGVEIVQDITDAEQTADVETLEGRIGPLLLAEGCQAHFIDMPKGMYVEEHPHSTESIIYTVRGRWVLCSRGRRHVMEPGTLFRFGKNVPTGYEIPFDENAFILIFKGDRTTKVESEFIDYLRGMAERLEKEHTQGVPYLLSDLPEDHPARQFARKVAAGDGE